MNVYTVNCTRQEEFSFQIVAESQEHAELVACDIFGEGEYDKEENEAHIVDGKKAYYVGGSYDNSGGEWDEITSVDEEGRVDEIMGFDIAAIMSNEKPVSVNTEGK